jgi:endonuclease YncB( thermonuclease family)
MNIQTDLFPTAESVTEPQFPIGNSQANYYSLRLNEPSIPAHLNLIPTLRPSAFYTFLLAIFLVLGTCSAYAGRHDVSGRVVRVMDGDTVEVLDINRNTHRIRLSGIDAPERGQAFGNRAKQALSSLVGGKHVMVIADKRDRYQRLIGKIITEGKDANLALVRDGMAWWFRKYAHEQSPRDRTLYKAAEEQARKKKIGLWRDTNPLPPWEYRSQPKPSLKNLKKECPCSSNAICTGPHGGRFCIRENGKKRYLRN